MSYSTLAVLAVVAVLVVDLAVYRTRMVTRRVFWVAYAIVIMFQLLMNGVLTGLDVVTYDPATISRMSAANRASCRLSASCSRVTPCAAMTSAGR